MSRCLGCNRTFAEENGWQEFCSLPCAQGYVIGRRVAGLDMKIEYNPKWYDVWNKWMSDATNSRRVRLRAEPEPPPRIGGGGEVIVRPITDDERATAKRYRGHGFYDCHVATTFGDDLPSLHWHVGEEWFPHDDDLEDAPSLDAIPSYYWNPDFIYFDEDLG